MVFATQGLRSNNVGGRPLMHGNVYWALQRELVKAGLPRPSLYSLCHLAASLLIAQGASLREVVEVLGHPQYKLTADTYVQIHDEMGRVKADRMDPWYSDPGDSTTTEEDSTNRPHGE